MSLLNRSHHSLLGWHGLTVFAIGNLAWTSLGCDQQPNGAAQQQSARSAYEAMRKYDEEHDRQMATWQRHSDETERQLSESAANLRAIATQNEQFQELLHRWTSQADRTDALLLRWEKLAEAMEQRVQKAP